MILVQNSPHYVNIMTFESILSVFLFKKMFEHGNIHVYSPGARTDNPLGTMYFIYINLLSICLLPAIFPPVHCIREIRSQ